MSDITIKENTVVLVHYRGTLTKNGEEFDNSDGKDPLTFMVGFRQMIPGFEAALMGKTAGDHVKFDLTSDQAYGERDPEAVQVVPLEQLPDGVKAGDQLAAQTPDGHVIPLSVTNVSEESATLDMNHELAGEDLTFEVEVIEVREATEEEVSHGHVHGPGGHDH
jgi:FKBP-type peptidyl-prolyl cis-trans isomerase SlyD